MGRLTDRYQLEQTLGRGSFGEVVRARDLEFSRTVAIKFLVIRDGSGAARERFRREARITAGLRHPGVVRVLDAGVEDSGRAYIVYEFIDGPDLETLRRRDQLPGVDPLGRWAHQVATALAAAHQERVLHRDVKPANILIRPGGSAVLADFGLSRGPREEATLTRTGELLGTPKYMAPELFTRADVGPASDQFAWAASFHDLLYGDPPYHGLKLQDLLDLEARDWQAPAPAPPPGTPPALVAALARALRRDPDQRFDSMDSLVEALDAPGRDSGRRAPLATATTPLVSEAVSPEPPAAPRRRVPPLVPLSLLLLLGAAGLRVSSPPASPPLPGRRHGEVPQGEAPGPPASLRASLEKALAGHQDSPEGHAVGAALWQHAAEVGATDPVVPLGIGRVLDGLADWVLGADQARLEEPAARALLQRVEGRLVGHLIGELRDLALDDEREMDLAALRTRVAVAEGQDPAGDRARARANWADLRDRCLATSERLFPELARLPDTVFRIAASLALLGDSSRAPVLLDQARARLGARTDLVAAARLLRVTDGLAAAALRGGALEGPRQHYWESLGRLRSQGPRLDPALRVSLAVSALRGLADLLGGHPTQVDASALAAFDGHLELLLRDSPPAARATLPRVRGLLEAGVRRDDAEVAARYGRVGRELARLERPPR